MGLAAIKLVKALDTTRPVLIPWRHEEWLPEDIDILSAHYWQPKAYDEWAGNSKRPVIATEYTHAYGEHGMGGLEARWNAIAKHPAGAGAAIWMWADQGIKTPIPPKTKIDPQFNLLGIYTDRCIYSFGFPIISGRVSIRINNSIPSILDYT